MWNMIWPVLIVVGANTIYNISTKSTPSDVNAFASLATSYFIAMLGSVVMFFLTSDGKNLLVELDLVRLASITSVKMGLAATFCVTTVPTPPAPIIRALHIVLSYLFIDFLSWQI